MKKGYLFIFLSWVFFSCAGSGDISQGKEWQRVSPDTLPAPVSQLSQAAENRKVEILKAIAQGLRDEAYNIQMKDNYQEAVIKYRKSLAYLPDPELDKYIRQVEIKAGSALTGRHTGEIQTQSSIVNVVMATIRNRSKRSVNIFPQGTPFSPDNLFKPGEIRFVSVPIQPDGKILFYAGWDGTVVDSEIWTGDRRNPGKIPSVWFDDQSAGKLVVMTGLR
jgi:hypothetical protein